MIEPNSFNNSVSGYNYVHLNCRTVDHNKSTKQLIYTYHGFIQKLWGTYHSYIVLPMSIGGIEVGISMSPSGPFTIFLVFWDIDISASTPPMDMKLAPKCFFQECFDMACSFI